VKNTAFSRGFQCKSCRLISGESLSELVKECDKKICNTCGSNMPNSQKVKDVISNVVKSLIICAENGKLKDEQKIIPDEVARELTSDVYSELLRCGNISPDESN
jgi:hypothetical protein